MRITDLQERTVSIASEIRNAYIDFSKMAVSVVALYTDIIRNGKPVVAYGFNSNGRYAKALQPYNLRWYKEPGDPLD